MALVLCDPRTFIVGRCDRPYGVAVVPGAATGSPFT